MRLHKHFTAILRIQWQWWLFCETFFCVMWWFVTNKCDNGCRHSMSETHLWLYSVNTVSAEIYCHLKNTVKCDFWFINKYWLIQNLTQPVTYIMFFLCKWIINSFRPRQMAAIFQTTFSNALSWMQMCSFRLRFHWSLFSRVKLTIFQHWFR